ncbi:MAG: FAD-dependent oxidoreductase [Candidatus Kapaibacteriota bacterium]
MKKVVIVGGMAAGCKTAARLRRLDFNAEITIVEKLPFVSFGACGMPFYAGGEVENFDELMSTPWGTVRSPEYFKNVMNVNLLTETVCSKLYPEHNFVEIVFKDGKKKILNYDYLVLATGSKPIIPKFPFIEFEKVSFFHSPLEAKKFRTLAERGQIGKVVIIGGGFIGCELAEAVSSLWGIETVLIEKENALLPKCFDVEISNLLLALFKENGINVLLNTEVEKIEIIEDQPVVFTNRGVFHSDYVLIALGVEPNTKLAQISGISIGNRGGIIVDSHLRTNFSNVYAAGDCIETTNLVTGKSDVFALGSLANRQGRVVADNISGLQSEFPGAVGAISLKVFDTFFANVGINSITCQESNINYEFAIGTFYDRPHYYPDTKTLFAKVLYRKDDGKLLGLQLCGKGEVTRYIDTFSALLTKGCDFKSLLNFEHSYTPPHSSPINPLNYLGGIIELQERFSLVPMSPLNLQYVAKDHTIIDLRKEVEVPEIPFNHEAMRIDFDNLLEELKKLQGLDNILCVCQKGPRSIQAAIFLKHMGKKNVSYLAGGLQLLNAKF